MKERRRQVRKPADESLFVYDRQTGAIIGHLVDMTEHGAMLLSEKPTKPNTTFQCRIMLPETTHSNDCISFGAECRWCIPDEKTGMYQTGYEFQEMTDNNSVAIRKLLKFWSESQRKTVEI